MPISHTFDLKRRLIIARISGVLTGEEIAAYQADVWSHPEAAGFHELIDMSDTAGVALGNTADMREVAERAAAMDAPDLSSRIAIVAPQDSVYGIARMYEAYRNMAGRGAKMVAVFRTLQEGLAFLGLTDLSDDADAPGTTA